MAKHSDRILYSDTDSIFVVVGLEDEPIEVSDFLGGLTDEVEKDYPNEHIEEFICAGPKNYAYRLTNGITSVKVKGFSLNYENSKKIHMDSMRNMIESMEDNPSLTLINENKITRERYTRRVVNKREEKKYQIVYDKRIILDKGANTIPFGYTWQPETEPIPKPASEDTVMLDLSQCYLFSEHYVSNEKDLGELFPYDNEVEVEENDRDIDLMATSDSESELSDLPTAEDLEFLAEPVSDDENNVSFYRTIDNDIDI